MHKPNTVLAIYTYSVSIDVFLAMQKDRSESEV